MKLAFMGTPAFAAMALDALIAAGHEIAAVYSQPPRPAGRGYAERPGAVHALALERGLPVRTPVSLKSPEEQGTFAALNTDVAVVAAYGLLLPKPVLDAPRLGCFNSHASLLPRWRGAAPVQRAIMAGDTETGVTIMRMAEGLDTGPMALTARVPIDETTNAGSLHDRLAQAGAKLMVEALRKLEAGTLELQDQPDVSVTYAAKIGKAETRIDFTRPAAQVLRHIHGLSPAPGAWCEMPLGGKPQRVKVLGVAPAEGGGVPGMLLDDGLTVACGGGALRLLSLQREGKGPMAADAFLRGAPLAAGTRL